MHAILANILAQVVTATLVVLAVLVAAIAVPSLDAAAANVDIDETLATAFVGVGICAAEYIEGSSMDRLGRSGTTIRLGATWARLDLDTFQYGVASLSIQRISGEGLSTGKFHTGASADLAAYAPITRTSRVALAVGAVVQGRQLWRIARSESEGPEATEETGLEFGDIVRFARGGLGIGVIFDPVPGVSALIGYEISYRGEKRPWFGKGLGFVEEGVRLAVHAEVRKLEGFATAQLIISDPVVVGTLGEGLWAARVIVIPKDLFGGDMAFYIAWEKALGKGEPESFREQELAVGVALPFGR